MFKTYLLAFCAAGFVFYACKTAGPASRSLAEDTVNLASPDASKQSDIPSAGRSFFDEILYRANPRSDSLVVPFPFEDLLAKIYETTKAPMAGTLIPIGRSLQRLSSSPEFFRYPRIVVTTLSPDELPQNPSSQNTPNDTYNPTADPNGRLFIAYNEPARALEVISFNETLGRFEF